MLSLPHIRYLSAPKLQLLPSPCPKYTLHLGCSCDWPDRYSRKRILATIDAEGVGFKRLCRPVAVEFLKCRNYRVYRIST